MIDEALYQRATDELNSDSRKPQLWARACALASDDHDEARYLYTNLRVEELISERDGPNSAGTPTPRVIDTADSGIVEYNEDTPTNVPVVPVRESSYDPSDLSAAPENLKSPTVGNMKPDRDVTLVDAPQFDETLPHDDLLTGDTSGIASHLSAQDDELTVTDKLNSPGGRPTGDEESDELEWLDSAVVSAQTPSHTDSMARFADNTPPRRALDPAVEAALRTDSQQFDKPAAAAPIAPYVEPEPLVAPVDKSVDGAGGAFGSGMRDDYADSRDLDALLHEDEEEADGDEEDGQDNQLHRGGGKHWAVYKTRSGALKFIKRGVSWGALFFTLPWLLYRGLIGTAIAYSLLWIVLIVGLLHTGLAWMDAGDAATPVLKLACAGFALVAFLGLIVLPFFRGNRWREGRYRRRGHTMVEKVRARSGDEAMGRVLGRS